MTMISSRSPTGCSQMPMRRCIALRRWAAIGSRPEAGSIDRMAIEPNIDFIDKDGFRANVGIVLTQGTQVFLGGRVNGRGWQFPQGGVSRGESVEAALFRELREEIGLEAADVEVLGQTRG